MMDGGDIIVWPGGKLQKASIVDVVHTLAKPLRTLQRFEPALAWIRLRQDYQDEELGTLSKSDAAFEKRSTQCLEIIERLPSADQIQLAIEEVEPTLAPAATRKQMLSLVSVLAQSFPRFFDEKIRGYANGVAIALLALPGGHPTPHMLAGVVEEWLVLGKPHPPSPPELVEKTVDVRARLRRGLLELERLAYSRGVIEYFLEDHGLIKIDRGDDHLGDREFWGESTDE